MHTYDVQKNGTDEPICMGGIEADIENRFVDTVWEGEGGAVGVALGSFY